MKELNLPATPIAFLQTTLGVLHRCARLLCEQYHTRTEHVHVRDHGGTGGGGGGGGAAAAAYGSAL